RRLSPHAADPARGVPASGGGVFATSDRGFRGDSTRHDRQSGRCGSPMTGHVVVIGAGIVGTCCALWLRRQGFRVTLVDPNAPGSGCSSGNAGMFQTGSVTPPATPGILRRVPRMLLDRNGPLVIRWRHLPMLMPWLIRLVRNASPARVDAIADALATLLDGAK